MNNNVTQDENIMQENSNIMEVADEIDDKKFGKTVKFLLFVLLPSIILIGVLVYFNVVSKDDKVDTFYQKQISSFLYIKHEVNEDPYEVPISFLKLYDSNTDSVTTVIELGKANLDNQKILYNKNQDFFIFAIGSQIIQWEASGSSGKTLIDWNKQLNDSGRIDIKSIAFSPDKEEVVYFLVANTQKYQAREIRVHNIASGKDEAIVNHVGNIKDTLSAYDNKFTEDLNPIAWLNYDWVKNWLNSDTGEMIIFAQEEMGFLDGFWTLSPNTPSKRLIYNELLKTDDYKEVFGSPKIALVPDGDGDKIGYCTNKRGCDKYYSIVASSEDGSKLLIYSSFDSLLEQDEDSVNVDKGNYFVVDFSLTKVKEKKYGLSATVRSLVYKVIPVQEGFCTNSDPFFARFTWSPDGEKIICEEYKISEFDLLAGPFVDNLKKSYEVDYSNYAIDINDGSVDRIRTYSRQIEFPEQYRTLVQKYLADPGVGAEAIYAYFIAFVQQKQESIIGWLPDDKFVLSRPSTVDNSKRELVVTDLDGNDHIIEKESTANYQFIRRIDF